jgi:hypothetical protein
VVGVDVRFGMLPFTISPLARLIEEWDAHLAAATAVIIPQIAKAPKQLLATPARERPSDNRHRHRWTSVDVDERCLAR